MRQVFFGLAILAASTLTPGWSRAGEAEDMAIAHAIAKNIRNSGRLRGYQIGVKMKGPVAWLVGTVASPEQEQTALRIANKTPGVVRSVSELKVGGANRSGGLLQPTAGSQVPAM